MEQIEHKVREVLKQTFTDNEIRFDHEPGERISGFIVSNSFVGMDHEERQKLIWTLLRSHLNQDERKRILAFLAFTPDEEQFYSQAYDD